MSTFYSRFTFMLAKPYWHAGLRFILPIYGHCHCWLDPHALRLSNQYWCWNPDATLDISVCWSQWWRYGVRLRFWDKVKVCR